MNQTKNGNAMNLYILNDVLYDYTAGMAVIAAESMEHCKELFMKEFGTDLVGVFARDYNKRLEEDFNTAEVKVIEGVNYAAGIVSYVRGGG